MKRIIASVLIVLVALTAVIIQRQTSDERVVLVGYGKGAGWSGTEYVTAAAEEARDTEAIELTIQQLYNAINTYNSDLLHDVAIDSEGKWQTVLDDAEYECLHYNVDIIGDPSFEGDTCEVEVTTTVTSATETMKELTSTQTIRFVRQHALWAVQ